jgi:putative membrane protein
MLVDALLRFLKGALIGTGFILPGVSGGALAAVFGLYERIIRFIAHITHDFVKNVLFFIPVALGALFGMFVLAQPLSFFLSHYEAQVLWLFIGCIAGTLPALWHEAGKKGRGKQHYLILALSAVVGFALLYTAERFFGTAVPLNFFTWLIAGLLIALGVLVPGMSPSNFLVYMGMYKPMVDAFKTFDLFVLLPLFGGFALCLVMLSKAMAAVFERAHTGLFHIILGVVLASTLMIVPTGFNYASLGTVVCALAFLAGIALGLWMSKLDAARK